MNSTTINVSITDSVAILTLNRPDKFNSFNRDMALALQEALDDCSANESVRCIVLTGNGKAFCAGQDLAEAIDPNGPGIKKIVGEHYNPIIKKLRSVRVPVLCAVNGVAAGAGANIAFAGDIVVATKSASFIQAFSKIGLVPDSGGTWILPRLIGYQQASALMMLGDKVSAEDALKMGMLYRVYEDASFMEEVMQLAKKLAEMPTKALLMTRELLMQSASNTLDQQLDAEGEYQAKAASTEDYREGVNAFLEKRSPRFKGK
jgi:2-(1,2-epoxy-1,2-dihydrophenyl)acetyl-CoA isomerase